MTLRCSILGHSFGDTTTEQHSEEGEAGTVLTVREYRTCRRCGAERDVYENRGVISPASGTEDPGDGPEPAERTDPPAGSSTEAGDGREGPDEGPTPGADTSLERAAAAVTRQPAADEGDRPTGGNEDAAGTAGEEHPAVGDGDGPGTGERGESSIGNGNGPGTGEREELSTGNGDGPETADREWPSVERGDGPVAEERERPDADERGGSETGETERPDADERAVSETGEGERERPDADGAPEPAAGENSTAPDGAPGTDDDAVILTETRDSTDPAPPEREAEDAVAATDGPSRPGESWPTAEPAGSPDVPTDGRGRTGGADTAGGRSTADGPRSERYVCGECGFEVSAGSTPIHEGDICTDCRDGYFEYRRGSRE